MSLKISENQSASPNTAMAISPTQFVTCPKRIKADVIFDVVAIAFPLSQPLAMPVLPSSAETGRGGVVFDGTWIPPASETGFCASQRSRLLRSAASG